MALKRWVFLFFVSLLVISTVSACKKNKNPTTPPNLFSTATYTSTPTPMHSSTPTTTPTTTWSFTETGTPTVSLTPTHTSTATLTPTVTLSHTQTLSPTFTGTIPPTPVVSGEILYTYSEPAFSNCAICRMNASNLAAVTIYSNPSTLLLDAKWNSDKSLIVFAYGDYDNGTIRVMDSDGIAVTQISTYEYGKTATRPDWSPDDSKIAYTTSPNSSLACTIHVMNPDGTGDVEIFPSGLSGCVFEQWVSNTRILFSHLNVTNGEYRLYEMDLDGTDLIQLFDDPDFGDANGAWNPSKTLLAFSRYPSWESAYSMMCDLWIFNGSSIQGITNTPYCYNDYIVWSPDGAYLVYRKGGLDCAYSMYRVQADGTNETVLLPGCPSDWR